MASAASPSDNSPTTDSSKSSPADDPPSSSSESSPPSSDTSPPPPDDDKSPTKSSPSNADNTPNQPSQSVPTPNSGSNPAPSNPSSSSGSSPLPLNPSSDNSGEFAPPSKSGGNWKPGPPGVKHRSPPDGKDGEPDDNLNNNWKPGPPGVKHRSPPDGKDGDPDDNWKPGPPGVKHRSPPDGKDGDPDDSGGKSKSHESNSNNTLLMGIGLGIGMFVVLMLISALFYVIKKKRKPRYSYPNGQGGKAWQNGKGMDHNIKIPPPPGGGWQQQSPVHISGDTSGSGAYSVGGNSLPPLSPNYALGFNKSTFSYEEVAAATGGFAPSNMIGQGGFGYVYKGVLPTGKEVAVKQLKSGSGQGEREFQAEVEIISRVHHRHLVSLVGYCISGVQRMLIYDFVPNNTLEYHLHGKGVPTMDWPTRLKIAIGSAKGLAYLHEDCHPRIIHRDIKASNILIDYKYEAMVADFGLAKMNSDTNTHISTRVMGTFGYLAPEYASTGKLTEKSDVYSFGVMLLELISGRKPVDHTNMMEDSLVDWARPMLGQVLAEEKYELVVDPNLERNFIAPEMARMIACAAASVRHSARRRPKMSQIVRALEGDIVSFDDLNDGVKPGQSSQFSGSGGSSGSQDLDSGTYSTKMRQFRRIALEETNEYSNDYGLNPSDSSTTSSGEMRFGAAKKASQQV